MEQWQSCAAVAEESSSEFRANFGGYVACTETASSRFEESGGFMFRFHKLFREKINLVFRQKTHRSSVRRYFQCFPADFFLPTNFWWSKQWSSPEATERGDFPYNLQTSSFWSHVCFVCVSTTGGSSFVCLALEPKEISLLHKTVVWSKRKKKHLNNQNNGQIYAGWLVWWRSVKLGKGRIGLQNHQLQLSLSNNGTIYY